MARTDYIRSLQRALGPGIANVLELGTGWPSVLRLRLPSGRSTKVIVHASTVSPHARRDYELRFQNPANRSPVESREGGHPVLLGFGEVQGRSILVAVDGASRMGRVARFSILFRDALLKEAAAQNWAVYRSSSGENIFAFVPSLFPVFVELLTADALGETPSHTLAQDIAQSTRAAGLGEDSSDDAAERARKSVDVLVRHYAFGRSVVGAYDGRCAACGIDFGFVVGAHIHPVSAPGSVDQIRNGVALCHFHHALFDRHLMYISPITRSIKLHPSVEEEADRNETMSRFIAFSAPQLVNPARAEHRPATVMFERRYEFYRGYYDWS